jgi:hypothetical protein
MLFVECFLSKNYGRRNTSSKTIALKNISLKINHPKTFMYIRKVSWVGDNDDVSESEGEPLQSPAHTRPLLLIHPPALNDKKDTF